MHLGNFSVSLAVKDIQASRAFYEELGFRQVFGEVSQGWVIMKNGSTNIGLFQGMFDRNMLTFNPGWDQDGIPLSDFDDIRTIHTRLKQTGIEPDVVDIKTDAGPASLMIRDPDGNQILIDQHV